MNIQIVKFKHRLKENCMSSPKFKDFSVRKPHFIHETGIIWCHAFIQMRGETALHQETAKLTVFYSILENL